MTLADITSFVAPKRQFSLFWTLLVTAVVLSELLTITGIVLVVGDWYYTYFLGANQVQSVVAALGVVTSGLYFLVSALRGDYTFAKLSRKQQSTERLVNSWSMTMACLMFVLVLTKSSHDYSRGALAISYVVGLVALGTLRRVAANSSLALAAAGKIAARRMMLVGTQQRIASVSKSNRFQQNGIQIVGTAVVTSEDGTDVKSQLDAAVDIGRRYRPDEVMLLLEWSDKKLIQDSLGSLLVLPASISLGPEMFDFPMPGYQTTKINDMLSVQLVREPLRPSEIVVKRAFDLFITSAALIMLAPVFLLVALAIKIESPGPIFFKQKRYGFNRDPFSIYKFRSMSASSGQEKFKQAVKNDGRVTRVGRYIRKLNLDELPQLLNVMRGDMSLVGPRPHPIDLDHHFTERLALYSRRHNVLPGITGWAQINSFRGVTDEEWKMEGRLIHDLYYLDNWSVWFDLKILVLTVIGPKAFANAG
jgi:Undecaprenyl-phosphate glucose phosphotransferase